MRPACASEPFAATSSSKAALFVLDLASEATFDGDEAGHHPRPPQPAQGHRAERILHAASLAAPRRRFRLHPRALCRWRQRRRRYRARPSRQLHSRRGQDDRLRELAVEDLGAWDGGVAVPLFRPRGR